MKTIVDACGMACPLPVVKANQALAGMADGILEVHVDNAVAVENVKRMAQQKGLTPTVIETGEKHYVVSMEVHGAVAAEETPIACQPIGNDYIVAVDTDVMGRGDENLGRTLMKGFLFALSQLKILPKTILFYNGGAKLTVNGSDSLEDLNGMAQRGVEILTCGTCLSFYGLTEKLAVGAVTNMYTIVEKLTSAGKVVKP